MRMIMPGLFQSALAANLNNTQKETPEDYIYSQDPARDPTPRGPHNPEPNKPNRPYRGKITDPNNFIPADENDKWAVAYQNASPEQQARMRDDANRENKANAEELMGTRTAEAELKRLEAEANLADKKYRDAMSPEAAEAARLLQKKAQLELAIAELNLAKAQDPTLDPRYIAQYEHELNLELEDLRQEHAAAMQDGRIAAEWNRMSEEQRLIGERESVARRETQDFTSEENQKSRDFTAEQNRLQQEGEMNKTRLTSAVNLRGQELERLSAQDKFTIDTVANKLRKGEIGIDRAYKMMDMQIKQRKLPSEIAQNIGQAMAPFVPHMTSYQKGDIPLGFEAGGPFEIAMRQGGATSYDPNQYAANPVQVDLFGAAKKMGGNVPTTPLSNPANMPDLSGINTDLTSNLSQIQMTPEIEEMIKSQLGGL